jgi:N-acetylmuramic acid 6-phosphate etherase
MPDTELPHAAHPELDRYDTARLVAAFVDDQDGALAAVRAASPALVRAVERAAPRLADGGRLMYAGAGTSGRLGVLDSVELLPTFSWPRERAPSLIAGGPPAMLRPVEDAEDDAAQGRAELAALRPTARDVAIVISASGTTPYALGAAAAARDAGALTIGIANNAGAPLLALVEIPILLDTGPEVISGSTRLKAGTAQKIALNTLSSALMVRLHKVHGNLMLDLLATNAKLRRRALALTVRASGTDEVRAAAMLARCDGQVKTAVVALLAGCEPTEARARLERAQGSVRDAVAKRAA